MPHRSIPPRGSGSASPAVEADRDVQLALAVRPVAELHARHHPRVGQLQSGGEQRNGIHTTKLPERPYLQAAFAHTKQRKIRNIVIIFSSQSVPAALHYVSSPNQYAALETTLKNGLSSLGVYMPSYKRKQLPVLLVKFGHHQQL